MIRMPRWSAATPLALLLAGSGLQAQSTEYGVQAGIQTPMGDLGNVLDHSLGYSVGAHMGIYYGQGHELRPRFDYQSYSGDWVQEGSGFAKHDVTSFGLGADYVYYTEQRRQGLYLTMGLGYNWWSVTGGGGDKSSLGLAAGAGYRLNQNWSFEARYTTGQFRSDNGQASAVQGVAFFHF